MKQHWTDTYLPPRECERFFRDIARTRAKVNGFIDFANERITEAGELLDEENRKKEQKPTKSNLAIKTLIAYREAAIEQLAYGKMFLQSLDHLESTIVEAKRLPSPVGAIPIILADDQARALLDEAAKRLFDGATSLEMTRYILTVKIGCWLQAPKKVVAEAVGTKSLVGKAGNGKKGGRPTGSTAWYEEGLKALIGLAKNDLQDRFRQVGGLGRMGRQRNFTVFGRDKTTPTKQELFSHLLETVDDLNSDHLRDVLGIEYGTDEQGRITISEIKGRRRVQHISFDSFKKRA